MEDVSDEELFLMHREGDPDAFEVLFARHHRSVYAFACFMLGREDGAADVMQETFLAMARAAQRYEPRGRFRPWMMRIARNFCLNRLRAARSRREAMPAIGTDPADAASGAPGPAEKMEWKERSAGLARAIRTLPEGQREAILLRAFEEMSYQEISQALDAPLNTVKTWIHRARCTLAERLKEL